MPLRPGLSTFGQVGRYPAGTVDRWPTEGGALGGMVFTRPVRTPADDQRYPRRAVLSAGAATGLALALTGCGLLDRKPEPPPGPDPLEPVRSQAQALANQYDATMAAVPTLATRLTPLRDAHRAHLAELTRVIGTPAPSGPAAGSGSAAGSAVPVDAAAALGALRTAEDTARAAATTVCLAVPAAHAALVGSIVACRASHVEVLQ